MPHHLPATFIESLEAVHGFHRDAFLHAHQLTTALTSVRINPAKPFSFSDSKLIIEEPVSWCSYGYYLTERPFFTHDPLLHAGAYYVQEASSMFLWQVLKQAIGENTRGLKVLDLCAAPGGKSTLLASYFTDGLVVANEVIKSRANVLCENIAKWGMPNVIATNNDPADFARLENYFDVIVVDAPCSGSGLFRKDPEAIEEWSEENVQHCSMRQQRILKDVLPALKKNGLLIYSTCSYSTAENENILDHLSSEYNFSSHRMMIGEYKGITETQSDIHENYGYRFYPDKVKGEGFFIAALQKSDGEESSHQKAAPVKALNKSDYALVANYIADSQSLFLFYHYNDILAMPAEWKDELAVLQKNLYLRKAGIHIGVIKQKDFIPHHELAVSTLEITNITRYELDYEKALLYLKRKDFALNANSKGWAIALYKNSRLGLMKVLPNRINNYYPQEWRILKD